MKYEINKKYKQELPVVEVLTTTQPEMRKLYSKSAITKLPSCLINGTMEFSKNLGWEMGIGSPPPPPSGPSIENVLISLGPVV